MKEIKNICITLIWSLLLSFAFINIGSTQTPTNPTISVEPTNYTGRAGSLFDVTISVYDAGSYLVEDTDVYAWQVLMNWDNTVLDIVDPTQDSFGDFMNVSRVGPWGELTANAASGQYICNVGDGSKFAIPDAWGKTVVIRDDFNSELNNVTWDGQNGNQLTMENSLAHTYTVAAGGGVYPWPDLVNQAVVGPFRNRIMVGQTTVGAPPGVSGDGWLCTLTFEVLAEGTTTLDIDGEYTGDQTYITTTLGEYIGEAPSGEGDPGFFQSELFKDNGYFILPWVEDFDADGAIDIFDLASVALKWGWSGTPGSIPEDVNDDGDVTVDDLTMVSVKFGIYANA